MLPMTSAKWPLEKGTEEAIDAVRKVYHRHERS